MDDENREGGEGDDVRTDLFPIENISSSESSMRAFISAVLTLVLSILGSSVLSIPYAWSRLGILAGIVTQIVVALCNALASVLLLKTASKVQQFSYESVAEAVGGPAWKVITQISLFILLFGTIVGDFALLGHTAQLAVDNLAEGRAKWLGDDGRLIMILVSVFCIVPLCCLRRMRSLESAATAGFVVVLAVLALIIYDTAITGFPAIRDGQLPLWSIKVSGDLPEAMAVMGFAFYVTPMLLPLRAEMPSGEKGNRVTIRATLVVVLVISQIVYGLLGAFGAARHGLATQGNVMVNKWLSNDKAQGVLDLIMAVYLGISIPPISLSLRCTLTCLIEGEGAAFRPTRHYAITITPLVVALGIALIAPNKSEKIFAITGATGVMLICYLLPVVFHLMLTHTARKRKGLDSTARLLHHEEEFSEGRQEGSASSMWWIQEIILPSLVGLIGVAISVAALVIAVMRAVKD